MHKFKVGDSVRSLVTGKVYTIKDIRYEQDRIIFNGDVKVLIQQGWWPAKRFELIHKYKVVFISSPSELEKILNENQEWKFNAIYQDRIIFSRD